MVAQNDAPPLLEVRDLRIAFSGQEAVRGVSFAIGRGETLGLVGESGSGKSATSLAILRLLPESAAVSGSIRLWLPERDAGEELLTLPEERMRAHRGQSIAMIFQEPMTALNPVMTVGRQIGEAVLAHAPKTSRKNVRERVLNAMREVALPEPEQRMNDYPHQFSGG
ncbi:MAG TPA: ATP-binding cassette domain-containing protein [Acidobacteriaceae bacterium]